MASDSDTLTREPGERTEEYVSRVRQAVDAILDPVVTSRLTTTTWFAAREPELYGESPASWIRAGSDPEAVLEQARRYASRLAQ